MDPEERRVEVWTPGDTLPRLDHEVLTWHPEGGGRCVLSPRCDPHPHETCRGEVTCRERKVPLIRDLTPTTEVAMPPRQARLRSTYSEWYAGIAPGTWHHALWVREKALANLRHGRPQWENRARERVLSDSHFEFQGGAIGNGGHSGDRRMVREEE